MLEKLVFPEIGSIHYNDLTHKHHYDLAIKIYDNKKDIEDGEDEKKSTYGLRISFLLNQIFFCP